MGAGLVESAASVSLRDDGDTRIAVVADTHSRPHPAMAEHLAALAPDAILHAGDIGDLAVLDGLRDIAPLHVVRGNIDTRAIDLPDVLTLDLRGRNRTLRLLLIHIAVYGPKLRADVAKRARDKQASMVVCGHSHVPFIGRDRGLTVFNPGFGRDREARGVQPDDRSGARMPHAADGALDPRGGSPAEALGMNEIALRHVQYQRLGERDSPLRGPVFPWR